MPAALLAAVFAYFTITLVLPIDTMGDPAFDTAMLRARWFSNYGFATMHLAAIALALPWLWFRRGAKRIWLILGLIGSIACLWTMIMEYDRIIEYGLLIGTETEAMARLTVSRVATFLLSGLALLGFWRSRKQ